MPPCRPVHPAPQTLADLEHDPNFTARDESSGAELVCPLLTKDGQETVFNTLLAAMIGLGPQGYVEAMKHVVARLGSAQTNARTGKTVSADEVQRLRQIFDEELAPAVETTPGTKVALEALRASTAKAAKEAAAQLAAEKRAATAAARVERY